MKQNYKIVISYDGTDYHGWQRQPQKRTIQGLLEECLDKIFREKINVIGAGRTDAGVHALGQVANFKARLSLSEDELLRALNSLLPYDIRIISLKSSDPHFHARKEALSKNYQYRIFNSTDIPPFLHRYVLYIPFSLDFKAMKKAAPLFRREANFNPFSSNRLLHPVRKVTASKLEKKGKEIIYVIEAKGFLRYMVRTIVGTLLEIGKGKMSSENIENIFKHGKRTLAGPTAPAKGLCLMKVSYKS